MIFVYSLKTSDLYNFYLRFIIKKNISFRYRYCMPTYNNNAQDLGVDFLLVEAQCLIETFGIEILKKSDLKSQKGRFEIEKKKQQ